MTADEVEAVLTRLLAGGLTVDEAHGIAARAGHGSFAELCAAELGAALPGLTLERATLRGRLLAAAADPRALDELRAWAEEVATILDRHHLGGPRTEHQRLLESLALVAVAADTRIFRNRATVCRVLAEVGRALDRRGGATVSTFYGELFDDQPELHLLVRRIGDGEPEAGAGDDGDDAGELPGDGPCGPGDRSSSFGVGQDDELPGASGPPSFAESLGLSRLELDAGLDQAWQTSGQDGALPDLRSAGALHADVVALSGAWVEGARVQDYEWVVAFSVATRELVAQDAQPATLDAAIVERARALAPNFDLVRYRPEARRDLDGVLELVLDAPVIGRAEVVYAAKLFALVHRVGHVTFEGARLPTIAPVGGRPARDLA